MTNDVKVENIGAAKIQQKISNSSLPGNMQIPRQSATIKKKVATILQQKEP